MRRKKEHKSGMWKRERNRKCVFLNPFPLMGYHCHIKMHPCICEFLGWRVLILDLSLLEICGTCSVYWVTGPAGLCNKKLIYTPAQESNICECLSFLSVKTVEGNKFQMTHTGNHIQLTHSTTDEGVSTLYSMDVFMRWTCICETVIDACIFCEVSKKCFHW